MLGLQNGFYHLGKGCCSISLSQAGVDARWLTGFPNRILCRKSLQSFSRNHPSVSWTLRDVARVFYDSHKATALVAFSRMIRLSRPSIATYSWGTNPLSTEILSENTPNTWRHWNPNLTSSLKFDVCKKNLTLPQTSIASENPKIPTIHFRV